ncbi:MAG: ribose transport system permease protein [Thermotogaceae bacterium]|nr:ribose transport system permease protein [Thermotogaceae bacterium]
MRENAISLQNYRTYLSKFQSLIILISLTIIVGLLSERFFSINNMWNILRQTSVNLCISVGMTMVILTGGIDLSVGSVLGFTGAVIAGLLKNGLTLTPLGIVIQYEPLGAAIVGILVGLALGLFNGFVITKFRVPPFVATLGMLTAARGFTMLWTKGYPITGLGEKFGFIGTGWLLGIPMPVWISGIIAFLGAMTLRKTRFGRYIYAIGGNEKAAKLSGVNVDKIKLWTYAISGALSAIAGLIVTSRLDSAQPNAGTSYELDAIAAVVIGGTSLSGGKGSIIGTVQGALIMGVLNNGLVLMGVSPFWQQVIKGFVIILAVILDKLGKKEE